LLEKLIIFVLYFFIKQFKNLLQKIGIQNVIFTIKNIKKE